MDMLAVRSYDLVPWDVVVGLLQDGGRHDGIELVQRGR